MTEEAAPKRRKSEELKLLEEVVDLAVRGGLTFEQSRKALAVVRYWETLEPELERHKEASKLARDAVLAAQTMFRSFRPVLVAYAALRRLPQGDEHYIALQDGSELDAAIDGVNEALKVFETKVDELNKRLSSP